MKTITRSEAIEHLRPELLDLVENGHSLCEVAAEFGFFCGGFSRWTFEELKERFPWIMRAEPNLDRRGLEQRADEWLMHLQDTAAGKLPCDVLCGTARATPCHGWDEFYEAELARYCSELCGETVRVVPDGTLGADGTVHA